MNREQLAHIFIFLWLFCQMLQIGLSVTTSQVWESTKHAKVLSKGIAVNFLIVPLIGFGLLLLFKPDPLLSVGFLIAICFSGAPMGPPFTGLAKGSLPFAIGLMVILAALTPLISPAVLSSLISLLPERVGIGIEYLKIIRTILVGQFLPLAAGLALKGLASSFASRSLVPIKMTTNILMLAACVLVIVTEYKSLGLFGVNAAIGITTLFVSSALAGWWLGHTHRSPSRLDNAGFGRDVVARCRRSVQNESLAARGPRLLRPRIGPHRQAVPEGRHRAPAPNGAGRAVGSSGSSGGPRCPL